MKRIKRILYTKGSDAMEHRITKCSIKLKFNDIRLVEIQIITTSLLFSIEVMRLYYSEVCERLLSAWYKKKKKVRRQDQ